MSHLDTFFENVELPALPGLRPQDMLDSFQVDVQWMHIRFPAADFLMESR